MTEEVDNLIGIGGDFITYFINSYFMSKKYTKYYGFTNSMSIYDDAKYNINDIYNFDISEENSKIFDIYYHKNYTKIYEKICLYIKKKLSPLDKKCDLIINLSKVHIHLIAILSKYRNYFNKIIIISCNKENLKKVENNANLIPIDKYMFKNYINNEYVTVTIY